MEVTTLASELDAVTVYAQGALCTRRAKLVVVDGKLPAQVRIAGLPLSARPGSLRARVLSGPTDLRVHDVRAAYDAQLPSETDVPEEQRALKRATDKLGALELQQTQLQREVISLSGLRPSFPERKKGAPPRPAAPAATLALAELIDAELKALYARLLEVRRELKDARDEADLHQRRLAEASSARRTERTQLSRAALIHLTVPEKAEPAELAVEYLVPGARWFPAYDLRLVRSLESGTLQVRASIAQRTGEDWRNVRLSLSTANIDRRTDVPELRSRRVGRSQPKPLPSGRAQQRFAARGEGVKLSFGSEDALRVSRAETSAQEESRITGRRTTMHTVKLFVSNSGGDATRIALEERILVSEVKEVEVTLLTKQTQPAPVSVSPEGIVRFELSLEPRQRQEVAYAYEVSSAAKVSGI